MVMLETQRKKRKLKSEKLRKRRQTLERYKKKARELEKQVILRRKKEIRREQEELIKAHKVKEAQLLRAQKLLKEKKKLELRRLKECEKLMENRVRSLRKKLEVECNAICYEVGTGDDCNEPFSKDVKNRISSLKSEVTEQGVNEEIAQPNKSDEEICRVLNALLDTEICFNPDIISRIKELLKKDAKMQEFFKGYGCKKNIKSQLRFQVFNRLGPKSKLELILNSKNKKMNREQRDLLHSILVQVKQEHEETQEKSTFEKVFKFLWGKSGGQFCSKDENDDNAPKEDSNRGGSVNKEDSSRTMKHEKMVAPAKVNRETNITSKRHTTKAQQTDSKRERSEKYNSGATMSTCSTFSFELFETEGKPNNCQYQKQLSIKGKNKQRWTDRRCSESVECHAVYELKRCRNDIETPAPRFNLWKYFSATPRKTFKNQVENRVNVNSNNRIIEENRNQSKQITEESHERARADFEKSDETRDKRLLRQPKPEMVLNSRLNKLGHNENQNMVQRKCVRCNEARQTDMESVGTDDVSGSEHSYDTDNTDSINKSTDESADTEDQSHTKENPFKVRGILRNLFHKR